MLKKWLKHPSVLAVIIYEKFLESLLNSTFLRSVMKKALISAVLVAVFALGFNSAYAVTYNIKIPSGAADINAPYYWSVESTGNTDGKITIAPLDIIRWGNADTAAHTVTSGTAEDGPDGLFDSGLFGTGKFFEYQFMEEGEFDYFCLVHPWMAGTITVVIGATDPVHILKGVGANVDSQGKGIDVAYVVNRKLVSAEVDQKQKTVTFTLAGVGKAGNFEVGLPDKLITSPSAVWVDGQQIIDFKVEWMDGGTKLIIPVQANSEEVVILGSSVIPEFGTLATVVFVVATFSIIIANMKFQKIRISN
jgi:predicted secreted protein with PEFG-CTERM motif